MTRRTLAVRLMMLAGLMATSAWAEDPVARSLQLTAKTGSLPLWEKPSQTARNELGSFVRSTHGGVMLVGNPKSGFGTAWVLSREHRLLATNAHVADILHSSQGKMLAILNGTSDTCRVERVWYHPGVRRQISGEYAVVRSVNPADGPVDPSCPDVAVLQLAQSGPDLPVELSMAGPGSFDKLFAHPVGLLGYPGHDTRNWPQVGESAEATYHDGVISRLTNFQNSVAAPLEDRQFVQYTMASWSGFSGSPVFLPSGEVVAVHNSAQFFRGDAGDVKSVPHGIRIDCLWELIVHNGLDDRIRLPVDRASIDVGRWLKDNPQERNLRKAISLVAQAEVLTYQKKKFAEAVDKCTAAIELAPQYAKAYRERSTAYTNYWFNYRRSVARQVALDQLRLAERDARYYLRLDPTSPDALLSVALCLNNWGQFTDTDAYNRQALAIIDKLLQSDNLSQGTRASAYSKRGVAYHNLDQDQAALRDHNEAIRLDPTEPVYYETRADYWHYERRSDLEAQDYATARRLREAKN